MKGNFKDLKPGSDTRTQFWNQHKQDIFNLLSEIKADVFDGRGKIKENGWMSVATGMPPFTKPNYVYTIDAESLGVWTESSQERLRVAVEYGYYSYTHWENVDPNTQLVPVLRDAVSKLIG